MSIFRLNESRPTARKPHRCSLCGRLIAPGETYERAANVFDGRAYTWKTCAHCEAAIKHTSLGDYLDDCASWNDGYGPDDVSGWEPQTRRECVVKAQWERGWRYYNGPARLRRPEFPAYYSNRLRPDDSCPLVPVPSAAKEVDAMDDEPGAQLVMTTTSTTNRKDSPCHSCSLTPRPLASASMTPSGRLPRSAANPTEPKTATTSTSPMQKVDA